MDKLITGGIHEVASPDGEAFVRVIEDHVVGGMQTTIVELGWPRGYTGINGPDVRDRAADYIRFAFRGDGMGLNREQQRFLDLYDIQDARAWHDSAREDVTLISDLGYYCEVVDEQTIGDQDRQRVATIAPSLERWQALSVGAPQSLDSVQYAAFEGAVYPSLSAMRQFVVADTVYVATRRPEIAHDQSDHPIGWFLMAPKLRAAVKEQTHTAIERAAIEACLPPIGLSTRQSEQNMNFVNPAQAFLRCFWRRMDALSSGLVQALCFRPESGSIFHHMDEVQRVDHELECAFSPMTTEPPDSLIRSLDRDLRTEIAGEIIEYFTALGQLAVRAKQAA